ncbi:MAG: LysE family translocator [Bacteroidota bacterium]
MPSSVFEGIILGFTLAFLIGPSFIALIQTSIYYGRQSGIFFALGIVLSDLTLIALSYLGAMQFLKSTENQFMVGIFGGFILIAFGFATFFKKYKMNSKRGIEVKVSITGGGYAAFVLKGFFLNILNPFLLIFWLGVVSFISAKYGVGTKELVYFFMAALISVFVTDITKSIIASKIRRYLNILILTWANKLVGLALVVFGIVMFIRVFLFL